MRGAWYRQMTVAVITMDFSSCQLLRAREVQQDVKSFVSSNRLISKTTEAPIMRTNAHFLIQHKLMSQTSCKFQSAAQHKLRYKDIFSSPPPPPSPRTSKTVWVHHQMVWSLLQDEKEGLLKFTEEALGIEDEDSRSQLNERLNSKLDQMR